MLIYFKREYTGAKCHSLTAWWHQSPVKLRDHQACIITNTCGCLSYQSHSQRCSGTCSCCTLSCPEGSGSPTISHTSPSQPPCCTYQKSEAPEAMSHISRGEAARLPLTTSPVCHLLNTLCKRDFTKALHFILGTKPCLIMREANCALAKTHACQRNAV